MRRTAENRAGAVAHQHEIGHHHFQFPGWIERMRRGKARVVAQLLGFLDLRFRRAGLAAFGDKGSQLLVILCQFLGQRMFR